MTERWMVRLALAATLMLGSFLASAAEGGTRCCRPATTSVTAPRCSAARSCT
jgi:hypothetical protein